MDKITDALAEDRRRRHLAAFLGDCGIVTCDVCVPRRATTSPWVRRAQARALPAKQLG